MRRIAAGILLAAVLAPPLAAHAHVRSASYSSVRVEDRGARLTLRVSLLDLSALEGVGVSGALGAIEAGPVSAPLSRFLASRLTLRAASGACAADEASFVALATPAADAARIEWRVRCPGPPVALEAPLVHDLPGHTHFARVAWGSVVEERVLSAAAPSTPLRDARTSEGPMRVAARYLGTGVLHVLTGADHLAFLFLAVLLVTVRRDLLRVVTGFTLGHSLTLALVALGYLSPHTDGVEALIGLSVAALGLENGWLLAREEAPSPGPPAIFVLATATATLLLASRGVSWAGALGGLVVFFACYYRLLASAERPLGRRAAVATLFGLLHGMAFASVLTVERPPGPDLVPALLGFNVGVEVGQLALLIPLLPALRWIAGRPPLALAASAGGLGFGLFWFATRAF